MLPSWSLGARGRGYGSFLWFPNSGLGTQSEKLPLLGYTPGMGRNRYHIAEPERPHFMTATVIQWLPLFTRPETVNIVLESWRFLQSETDFRLYGYVILENHLHFIAQSSRLSRDVQRFKAYTAKQIILHLESVGAEFLLKQFAFYKKRHKAESQYQIWQEGSHPQLIQSETMLRQKLEYIHLNPVKRGYVAVPEHWRYSSASNYLGREGLIEVYTRW